MVPGFYQAPLKPKNPPGLNSAHIKETTMSQKGSVDRRDFLKSAAVTGAAAMVPAAAALNAQSPAAPAAASVPPTAVREADPPADVEVMTTDRPGGDFMVDVLKALNFEYIASN